MAPSAYECFLFSAHCWVCLEALVLHSLPSPTSFFFLFFSFFVPFFCDTFLLLLLLLLMCLVESIAERRRVCPFEVSKLFLLLLLRPTYFAPSLSLSLSLSLFL